MGLWACALIVTNILTIQKRKILANTLRLLSFYDTMSKIFFFFNPSQMGWDPAKSPHKQKGNPLKWKKSLHKWEKTIYSEFKPLTVRRKTWSLTNRATPRFRIIVLPHLNCRSALIVRYCFQTSYGSCIIIINNRGGKQNYN